MQKTLGKKSLLQKTAQVATSTIASKFLAVIRSILEIRYIGTGAVADAFWTAYKIPNMLRKVFAEGALSAAFIPTLVKVVKKDGFDQAHKLMTLTFIAVESVVLCLCFFVFFNAEWVIKLTAPGFVHKPIELATATSLLHILIFFIFFISSSALLGGAMQAKHHFLVPSWGPALLNVVYITGVICGLYWQIPVIYFAFFIIAGGALLLAVHLYTYFKLGFSFARPDKQTLIYFKQIMLKFLPCIVAMSPIDISIFINQMLASYLPTGSISLFQYAAGFFRIPLGTFAVAFSTVLLSHLSHINTYAPKRLTFYFFEAAKLILWVTLPAALLMSFFSHKLFSTLFLSAHFSLEQVSISSAMLIALLPGLFFFSVNKVLLSIYYSLHNTILPTIITVVGTAVNTLLNFLLMPYMGALSLAIATTAGGVVETVLFLVILRYYFNFTLYVRPLLQFFLRYSLQLSIVSSLFYGLYKCGILLISLLPASYAYFLTNSLGFWFWTVPLSLAMFGVLYLTRKVAHIKLYFLD